MSSTATQGGTPTLLGGEPLISLSKAAKQFPGHRENGHLNASTILRWIILGCLSIGGRRIKLEAVRLGSRWVTSNEAIARFTAALNDVAGDTDVIPIPPPRGAQAATAELDARLGIKRQ